MMEMGWRVRRLSTSDAIAPVAHTTKIHREASSAPRPMSAATATCTGSGARAKNTAAPIPAPTAADRPLASRAILPSIIPCPLSAVW